MTVFFLRGIAALREMVFLDCFAALAMTPLFDA
jgi:hypothetical protein